MSNSTTGKIYTVGHSNYDIDEFLEIITAYGIQIIVDVRSSPYSKYCPQFNKDIIQKSLHSEGIKYLYLGEKLGARPSDSDCYIHGRVSFDLLMESDQFKDGILRLRDGIRKKYVLALMCSEKEPINCHRTILISRFLKKEGIEVRHILNAHDSCSQIEIEDELQKKFKLEPLLFDTENSADDRISEAYKKQEERITYSQETAGSEVGT